MKSNVNLSTLFPVKIRLLPEIDVPFKGVKGWLSQGSNHQIVFFDIEPIGEVTKHKHGMQWGVVFDGEMELTVGENTKTLKRGDFYYIPEGVVHSAIFKKRTQLMDFFADKKRYKVKI